MTDWSWLAIALRNDELFILSRLPHALQFMGTDRLGTSVYDDNFSRRMLNPGAGTRFDALRFVMPREPDLWITAGQIDSHFIRLVGRTVIHDHHFEFANEVGQYFEQFDNTSRQSPFGIANGQDDTERLRLKVGPWGGGLGAVVHKVAPGGHFRRLPG